MARTAVGAGLGCLLDAAPLAAQSGGMTPVEGSPAPPLSLPHRRQRLLHLAAYRGRLVRVNFWATWFR